MRRHSGKPIGSDEENGKSTYPSLLGLEKCHALVHELSQQAVDALASFADGRHFAGVSILFGGSQPLKTNQR